MNYFHLTLIVKCVCDFNMYLGLQPQGSAGSSRLPLTSSRLGLWITSTLEMAAQICALDTDAANRAPVCK